MPLAFWRLVIDYRTGELAMNTNDPTQSENFKAWQQYLTQKAQNDATFRQQLINDPKATIRREIGAGEDADLGVLNDLEIVVHENTEQVMHLIIPDEAIEAASNEDELSDVELEMVAGGVYTPPKENVFCDC